MPKKRKITLKLLRSLILARSSVNHQLPVGLIERLKKAGLYKEAPNPLHEALKGEMRELMADTIARRLKADRRRVALVSVADAVGFTPIILSVFEKQQGKIDTGERKMFEDILKSMLTNMAKEANGMKKRSDLYSEYWEWIHSTLDLAKELGKDPVELVLSQEGRDEMVRRKFTKRRFISSQKRKLAESNSVSVLKKIVLAPLINMAENDEDRAALKKEVRQLTSELRSITEKINEVTLAWLEEEADRIYGPS